MSSWRMVQGRKLCRTLPRDAKGNTLWKRERERERERDLEGDHQRGGALHGAEGPRAPTLARRKREKSVSSESENFFTHIFTTGAFNVCVWTI